MQLQSVYLAHYPESGLTAGTEERKLYAARKDKIWMDNLQEIRQKLKDQTRRYEEIFKNEFVWTILKSCERAREELREINIELAKLQFSAKYQFSVDYIKDGSDILRSSVMPGIWMSGNSWRHRRAAGSGYSGNSFPGGGRAAGTGSEEDHQPGDRAEQ